MTASASKKSTPVAAPTETSAAQPAAVTRTAALVAYYAIPMPKGQQPVLTPIGAAVVHDDGEGFTLQLHLTPPAGAPIILRKPQIKKTA